MIIHQNSIFKLEYNPATDVLMFEYPDLHEFNLFEIRGSLGFLVETIRNYDVKRLLVDGSRTIITLNDEENLALSMYLTRELATTRLTKVARIQSQNTSWEARSQQSLKKIDQEVILPYHLKTFTDRDSALAWLAN